MATNITAVIKKNDSDFPKHLDFNLLRREGLGHIGRLSGEIWTDHNLHDPGVTILEILVYAMLDLGYRIQLPIEDLLAPNPRNKNGENYFFSPAQILSNNPTTILDYRKMLIDVPGVQNAWLEMANSETPIYLDCDSDESIVGVKPNQLDPKLTCDSTDDKDNKRHHVAINGLYKIILQLDRESIDCRDAEELEGVKRKVIHDVRTRLHNHRNLCEDFTEICILCEEEIGICLDLELHKDQDAEQAYVEVLSIINEFFTPPVSFYTLQEMLAQGKPIEYIFEGRPYSLESFGFIDSDELENIELKKEIHLSDLYKVIMELDSVKSIRSIQLNSDRISANLVTPNRCGEMIYTLSPDHVPVLCIDRSKIQLRNNDIIIPIDQKRFDKFWNRQLSQNSKGQFLQKRYLDLASPNGRYRSDLKDHISLQQDFPKVYGLGEGGLSEDATPQRKAQALQLQAYLLFFDQLFAGYVSQLTHLRDLFSIQPDALRPEENQHTYFVQRLNNVPGIEKILRFYTPDTPDVNNLSTTVLSYPVKRADWNHLEPLIEDDPSLEFDLPPCTFSTFATRNASMEQFQRELRQGERTVKVFGVDCLFFFTVDTSYSEAILISKKKYDTKNQARVAGESMALMGTLQHNFRIINDYNPSSHQFTYEIINSPVDYLHFLQQLTEDKQLYDERRNDFLNHLLARFNEQFIDYSLELFGKEEKNKYDFREGKARFLSNYDDLSRNRGRAFDYCKSSWESDNVSGFERQISSRLGYKDWKRKSFCNFEIGEYGTQYQYEIRDPQGRTLLKSYVNFDNIEAATKGLEKAWDDIRSQPILEDYDDPSDYSYGSYVSHSTGRLESSTTFKDKVSRDRNVQATTALFRKNALNEDLIISKYVYNIDLSDWTKKIIRRSKKSFVNVAKTLSAKKDFALRINTQSGINGFNRKLDLVAHVNDQSIYLDKIAIDPLFKLNKQIFRWQIIGKDGNILLASSEAYDNAHIAGDYFHQTLNDFEQGLKLITFDENKCLLKLNDEKGHTIANGSYQNSITRDIAINDIKSYFKSEASSLSLISKKNRAYCWRVIGGNGNILLESNLLSTNKRKAERAWRDSFQHMDGGLNAINNKEYSYISLNNVAGIEMARSAHINQDQIDDALVQIEEKFRAKKNITFVNLESGFSFRIPDLESPNKLLLESYHLYHNRGEAILALTRVLENIDQKSAYFPTGDEANLNFSYSMRDKSGIFLAVHPSTYSTKEERKKSIDRTYKYLKKYNPPLILAPENHFLIKLDGPVILKSEKAYKDILIAKTDFYQLMHLSRDTNNIGTKTLKNDRYQFTIIKNKETFGQSIIFDKKYIWKSTIREIQKIARENSYTVDTNPYPNQWKFQYWWNNNGGLAQPMMESIKTYSSLKNAKEAYRQLINNIDKLEIKKVLTQEKLYRLAYNYKGIKASFAVLPGSLLTKTDATKEKTAIKNLIKYVKNTDEPLNAQPKLLKSWVEPTALSKSGNYVYRLLKKDKPIAYHPCVCFEVNEDDDNSKDRPKAKIKELIFLSYKYTYCDFCMAGDVIEKIGLRYHYIVRDKANNKIYFRSFKAYDTMAEAQSAFDKDFMTIIELASDTNQYGTLIAIGNPPFEPNKLCPDISDPLVYIPKESLSNFEINKWVHCFCSYPIRRCEVKRKKDDDCVENEIKYKYYFHLIRNLNIIEEIKSNNVDIISEYSDECKILWKSTICYETTKEAWKDFRLFEYIVKNQESYRLYLDHDGLLQQQEEHCCCVKKPEDKKCCHYIALKEVLAESTCRYQTRSSAWGKDQPMARFPKKYQSLLAACETYEKICACLDKLTENPVVSIIDSEIESKFNFQITTSQDDLCALTSYQSFATEAVAQRASVQFIDALKIGLSCQIFRDIDCYYCIGVMQRSCPEHPCITDCSEKFLQKKGLNALLETSCDDQAFYPILDNAKFCCYSFLIVGSHFHLAKHPYFYNTPQERELARDMLLEVCSKKNNSNIKIEATRINPQSQKYWYYTIEDTDSPRLRLNGFQKISTSEEAVQQGVRAIEYGSEEQYYYCSDNKIYLLNHKRQALSFSVNAAFIKQHKAQVLAYHDASSMSTQQIEERIQELVKWSSGYPIRIKKDGYTFQVYCAQFPNPFPIDDQPCQPCKTKDNNHKSIGAIVWESTDCYDSIEKAQCYYNLVCKLLEKSNIRNAGDDCGPFGLELINPLAILAKHPQCYNKKSEMLEAIERTKKCMQIEGLHLIENVLLRPMSEDDCKCLLPIEPDCQCVLCTDPIEEDPCVAGQLENPKVLGDSSITDTLVLVSPKAKADCEEDEKFCVPYIPGSDPYSFIVTIALPAWSKQFSTLEHREWVKELFHKHAPAHIGLNILWLDPSDMCKFEDEYKRWLEWMRCENSCYPEFDLCQFVRCLFSFSNCPLPPPKKEISICDDRQVQSINISDFALPSMLNFNKSSFYSLNNLNDVFDIAGNFGILSAKSLPGSEIIKEIPEIKLGGQTEVPTIQKYIGVADSESTVTTPMHDKMADTKRENLAASKTKSRYNKSAKKIRAHSKPEPEPKGKKESISSREIQRILKSRKKEQQANLKNITNKNIIRTEYYKRTLFYLENNGGLPGYTSLIDFFISKNKSSKSKTNLRPYMDLVKYATQFMLDELVAKSTNKFTESSTLKAIQAKLANAGISPHNLVEGWDPEYLRSALQAPVVDNILSLLIGK